MYTTRVSRWDTCASISATCSRVLTPYECHDWATVHHQHSRPTKLLCGRLDVPHLECRLGINGKYECFLTDAGAPTSRNAEPGSGTVLIHQYVNEDGHHRCRGRRPQPRSSRSRIVAKKRRSKESDGQGLSKLLRVWNSIYESTINITSMTIKMQWYASYDYFTRCKERWLWVFWERQNRFDDRGSRNMTSGAVVVVSRL